MCKYLTLFICVLFAQPALAQEKIISFHSNIEVHSDRSLRVKETIKVQAEGKNIKRGIYRDFPTDYRDRLGNRYRVDFEVLSILNNGAKESFKTERISNGIRIYIGKENLVLTPGIYEYQITYRTNRQLGFF